MSVFEQKNSDALVVAGGNGSVLEVRVQFGGGGRGKQIKQFMSVFEQKNSDALVVAGGNGSVLEVRVQFGGGGGGGENRSSSLCQSLSRRILMP